MNESEIPTESGSALAEALRSGEAPDRIAERFGGRTIVGDVDITGLDYPHRLKLKDCTQAAEIGTEFFCRRRPPRN